MISSINGIYTGLKYSARSNDSNSTSSAPKNINNLIEKQGAASVAAQAVVNQLPVQNQVNTLVASEKMLDQSNSVQLIGTSQEDDIASLISMIEKSRDISQEDSGESLFKLLPEFPETEEQLMVVDADSSNLRKEELYTALVDNFKTADADKDNLVSYNDALQFINKY